MQGERRIRQFTDDWEQALNAPGSRFGRGKNQEDRLRELLDAAIGNRMVGGEETSVFQDALDPLNGEI